MSDIQHLSVPEEAEKPVESKTTQVIEAAKNLKEDSCAVLFRVEENQISVSSQNLSIANLTQFNIAMARFVDGLTSQFLESLTTKTEEVKNDV